MFILKKLITPLLSPLFLCVGLIALGLVLLWMSQKRKVGKILVTVGLLLLVISSYEAISGRILQTLESQYPRLDISKAVDPLTGTSAIHSVKWIVVLAGGVAGNQELPYQLQISHHSRVRLLEGIRLHQAIPGSKILLTGGIGFEGPPEATTISRVAEELGVKREAMVLEVQARDTKDHPRYVKEIVKQEPFILVTSAFHMPRAMGLFVKQGLSPIPAPAGHWVPPKRFWSIGNFFPSAGALRLAELAFHEYLGLAWAWLRGQI